MNLTSEQRFFDKINVNQINRRINIETNFFDIVEFQILFNVNDCITMIFKYIFRFVHNFCFEFDKIFIFIFRRNFFKCK